MTENQKNPQEYGYVGDEQITMTAQQFAEMKNALDFFLEKETKLYYPELYKYINKNTGEEIKKVTEKNADVAMKVVNVEGTLQATPKIFRTREGVDLLKLKLVTEQIHISMINTGVAKHKSYFEGLNKPQTEAPLGDTSESTEE